MAVDLAKQKEAFAKLKDELARLDSQFESAVKALGLKEGEALEMDPADVPQEVMEAMEAAKAKAAEAGRNAADAARAEEAPSGAPRRARRGAISI